MTAHRQIADPSDADIRAALAGRAPAIADLALAVRRLVREVLPDVQEVLDASDGTIGLGAHQYGADGWGIAAIGTYTRWVSVFFTRGAALPDPAGLLEGSGKSMRHVKLRSSDELESRSQSLRELLLSAASQTP